MQPVMKISSNDDIFISYGTHYAITSYFVRQNKDKDWTLAKLQTDKDAS